MKIAAIVLLATTFLSAKDIPLAVVVRLKGHAQLGLAKAMKPAKAGDVVCKNWLIKTESDGRVLLRFLTDKSFADMKASTLLELGVRSGGSGGSAKSVVVHGGAAAFALPPGNDGDRVETSTTVASATKGAQFGMSTATDGLTRVDVLTGTVQVCNQMTGEHVAVTTGQSQTSGYGGLGPIRQISSDSSLAVFDGQKPATIATSPSTSRLSVPFIDPVTGLTTTLEVDVSRNR
ncbi:MAG: hypothetical protein AAB214_14670 [Fibrobacterota bacterium]